MQFNADIGMDRLITKNEVGALLGLHPESVMRLVRQGQFPPPVKITTGIRGRVRFELRDIRAWLETRKQAYVETKPFVAM